LRNYLENKNGTIKSTYWRMFKELNAKAYKIMVKKEEALNQ